MNRRRYFAVLALSAAGCAVSSSDPSVSTEAAVTSGAVQTRCGTPSPTADESFAADRAIAAVDRAGFIGVTTKVPVYIHVIMNSAGEGDPSDLIAAQMRVLNRSYERIGFRFELKGVDKTVNDAWYKATDRTPEERAMKSALRRGGADTLNIYTGVNDGSLLGWAAWPWRYEDDRTNDGVVMAWETMPGGGIEIPANDEPDGVINYSAGKTLVHEVGHWLGLYHTFEKFSGPNGCEGVGDAVLDTPAEKVPQFVCVARNSCPGGGPDPIHNYMDYVDDDCMTEFSDGQEFRAHQATRLYRGIWP